MFDKVWKMKEEQNCKHFPPSATHGGKRLNSLEYPLVFACMPPCFFHYWSTFHGKHVICHAKFNCPVGVVAAVASAVAPAVAAAVAVVVALVVVFVIHGFIEPRVKCLAIYCLQTLVPIA